MKWNDICNLLSQTYKIHRNTHIGREGYMKKIWQKLTIAEYNKVNEGYISIL